MASYTCQYPERQSDMKILFWVTIVVTVRIEPGTLDLGSKRRFTAFIILPEGYNVTDIDASTIVCEGAPAIEGKGSNKDATIYIAQFNGQDLVDVPTGDEVTLTVEGRLNDGTYFAGSDAIKVVDEGKQG